MLYHSRAAHWVDEKVLAMAVAAGAREADVWNALGGRPVTRKERRKAMRQAAAAERRAQRAR
jgi:hypothetical protein